MDGTNVDEDDGSFKLPDYTRHIEFNALAASNKDFRDCLNSSHGKLNFKNAEHLRFAQSPKSHRISFQLTLAQGPDESIASP
jgi:hypothetical protein